MPKYSLNNDFSISPDSEFEGDILTVGGKPTAERVLKAIHAGFFPWYNDPKTPIWFCPEERCIIPLETFRISKSVIQSARKYNWKVTFDRAFSEVIHQCSTWNRENETWILPEIKTAYIELHNWGHAHSVEVWEDSNLIGGLYGVCVGKIFSGESMFSMKSNASKFALANLIHFMKMNEFKLLDAQVENAHLMSLGAEIISRKAYLDQLRSEVLKNTISEKWEFELNQIQDLRS
ncbi:MAG: leucyl/phenylalanyl-tRNA--protein transferase [Bacteroidota bacterium]